MSSKSAKSSGKSGGGSCGGSVLRRMGLLHLKSVGVTSIGGSVVDDAFESLVKRIKYNFEKKYKVLVTYHLAPRMF